MYVLHLIWRICICIRLHKCREYKFETTDAVKKALVTVCFLSLISVEISLLRKNDQDIIGLA